jgi:hypothetical protein
MKKKLTNKFIILGVCLIIAAIPLLVLWNWNLNTAKKRAENYVETLYSLIPAPQSAVLEERSDNTMSTFSFDGIDFVGILEFPRYNSKLPISNDWGETFKYPCRFGGSVYNRTIQIGATTQKGQYDFYRELSVGDSVFFVDMEGNRFSYKITDLKYESHINQSTLQKENSDLALFVKNVYAFEYLVIYCQTAH